MREENLPLYPNAAYSGGVTSNTGDSIQAGMAIDADTMNMQSTWAAPVFYVPGEDRGRLSTMNALYRAVLWLIKKANVISMKLLLIMLLGRLWRAGIKSMVMVRQAG